MPSGQLKIKEEKHHCQRYNFTYYIYINTIFLLHINNNISATIKKKSVPKKNVFLLVGDEMKAEEFRKITCSSV